ncbi:DoxX family protein [Paenimyroides ceti]
MKPLIILLTVFAVTFLIIKILSGNYEWTLSGRIAMSAMLLFTAIGHFMFTKGMSLMIPDCIPLKSAIVYLTGAVEIILAIGILLPNYQILTGWLLIIFLLLVLPANIYASMKHIDYQKATFDGNGLPYLWIRIPLQIVFLVWTYFSTIYK